ncbi:DUF6251 family protein [Streptomyces sp. NPDC046887]|uniref:DUF6251 family protein n=1 Tax=Streptomyces sp. NPDC046887 TaxID=3155472 RepID=UPI0033F63063
MNTPQPARRRKTRLCVVQVAQAPTADRARLRLGAGSVAAGGYFRPLLVGARTAIAADIAFLAVVLAWGVVTVLKSIGGTEEQAAAKSIGGP